MGEKSEMTAQAIRVLEAEHRNIEVILDTLEFMQTGEGDDDDWGVYERAIALLEEYADGYHHAKEEDLLFPAMIAAGLPKHNSPVTCMEEEHVMARDLIQKMRLHLSKMDAAAMHETVHQYCNLLREHIAKEDNILYPMALHVISAEGWRELAEKFIEVEERLGASEDYVRRAGALRRRAHKI